LVDTVDVSATIVAVKEALFVVSDVENELEFVTMRVEKEADAAV
jgi:hypothetical protein